MNDNIICDECNGKGNVPFKNQDILNDFHRCKKCRGLGKLNWIENIFGRKELIRGMDEMLEAWRLEDEYMRDLLIKNGLKWRKE
jgi:hypothetical protein